MGDIILMAPRPHPTWFYHQPYSSVLYIVCFVPRCCSSVKRGLCVSIIPCFCALRLLFNKRNLICQAIHFAQTFPATVAYLKITNSAKRKKGKRCAMRCKVYLTFFEIFIFPRWLCIYLIHENCFKSIIVRLHMYD